MKERKKEPIGEGNEFAKKIRSKLREKGENAKPINNHPIESVLDYIAFVPLINN